MGGFAASGINDQWRGSTDDMRRGVSPKRKGNRRAEARKTEPGIGSVSFVVSYFAWTLDGSLAMGLMGWKRGRIGTNGRNAVDRDR